MKHIKFLYVLTTILLSSSVQSIEPGDVITHSVFNQNFGEIKQRLNNRGIPFEFTPLVPGTIKASQINNMFYSFKEVSPSVIFSTLNSGQSVSATTINNNFANIHSKIAGELSVRNCETEFGSGKETFSEALNVWQSCLEDVCDSNFHIENSACTINTRSCYMEFGIGQQTWNFSSSNYDACYAISCIPEYAIVGNICADTAPSLVVENGETAQINAGSVLTYSSVNIKSGGTLNINGASSQAPVILKVRGSFIVDGQIFGRAIHNGGNFSNASGNININYSISQSSGGAGGVGARLGTNAVAGAGGSQGNGNGGGGGGGSGNGGGGGGGAGGSGAGGPSGNGANGSAGFGSANGGVYYIATAGRGGAGNSNINYGLNGGKVGYGGGGGAGGGGSSTASGGGGGGGGKGAHGLGLYIESVQAISGSGLINLSGEDGYNGGRGGNGKASNYGGAGGGGGGGAGGSGGTLWIKAPSYSFSVDISNGNAGSSGGIGSGAWQTAPGTGGNGNPGSWGNMVSVP